MARFPLRTKVPSAGCPVIPLFRGGEPNPYSLQILIAILLIAGLLLTQALMGGFNLLFSLPGYSLIGVGAILTLFIARKRLSGGANLPAVLSAVVLGGYVLGRSLMSPVAYLARMDFYMVLGALCVYFLTIFFFKSVKQRLWVVYALFGIALLNTAAGLIQFMKGNHFMLMWFWPDGWIIPKLFRPDYGWRASGFYGCPNHLAGFLETLSLLSLACCFLGRGKTALRIVFAYFFVTCIVGFALTGSRGGYLSLTGGLLCFAAMGLWVLAKLRRERFWTALIAVSALFGMLVCGTYAALSHSVALEQRLRDIGDKENVRLLLWGAALKQFQLNPVVGTGSGTYLYYGRQFRLAAVQRDPIHVHNDYLELLAEYGEVGAGLMLLFIVLHLRSGFRGIGAIVRQRLRPAGRVLSDELALTVGATAATCTLIAHSVVDFNFHIPANTLYFAFLLGILARPTSDPKIVGERPAGWIQGLRFALPALGGVILCFGAPLLRGEYHAEWARVQLRNLLCVDALADTQTELNLLMTNMATGCPPPASIVRREWANDFFAANFLPRALEAANQGLAVEKQNPNLYYHLGEALRFRVVYRPTNGAPEEPGELLKRAGVAYGEGLKLFPQDARLQMKFAQALDALGRPAWKDAETIYLQALQGDPNLGELYAQYGHHLFLSGKLVRAEAYYHRALKFSDGSDIAVKGLEDIANVRARAQDPAYVAQFGDPMDDFDLEPPTEEDEKRGATEHE